MIEKIRASITNRRKKLTPSRVAFLGVYLGLIVALKYVFGFVPGIELITFMFMMAGIFFTIYEGLILVIAFNAIIVALYGWGTWQMVYWIIWPFDLITTKLLSKITKNKYVFAFWGFILGLLIAFWYFISSVFFYGTSKAALDLISALPINLIEGLTTSVIILTCGHGISMIFNSSTINYSNKKNNFTFSKHKSKYSIYIIIGLNCLFIVGIVLLFVFNHYFLELKESLMDIGRATKIT